MKRPGFSLMEILFVVAIVATLTGISIPLVRPTLAKAREAACLGNLRTLGVAMESYLQDHNQIMPSLAMGRASRNDDVPVIETVLVPYVDSEYAFKCPEDKREFAQTGSSYFWNHLQSSLPVSRLSFFGIDGRPDRIPLISDKEAWHPSGTNFLYADLSSSNRLRFAATN
jgi:prepilin-type N-terminal cleavage/methylation domain-containing protein